MLKVLVKDCIFGGENVMMRNITRSKVITVCAMIASLMGGALANPSVAAAALPNAPDVPQAPLDTPDTLVGSGVGDYTVAAPKVFWHLRTCDQKPPALANASPGAACMAARLGSRSAPSPPHNADR